MGKWFKGRFRELDLLEKYFPLVFLRWQAALWGGSILAVLWGTHFIVAVTIPPAWVNWSAVFMALFFAGYYVWRTDHIRLLPKFGVGEFYVQDSPTTDATGRITGSSIWVQLLPKCLTEAEVGNCQGHLQRVCKWSNADGCWVGTEINETLLLGWSHGNEVPKPVTLHPGIERRLNIFVVHSSNGLIMPWVHPMPLRAQNVFIPNAGEVNAFRFDVKLTAQDCPDVDVRLKVQLSNDPFKPFIELLPAETRDGKKKESKT